MATTAQQVFNVAMSLIDEKLETGVINADTTKVFEVNTPSILTMLQDELIPLSDYYKTYTITKSAITDNAGGYASYTMPTDFKSVYEIKQIETGKEYKIASNYQWEGKNTLLIPDSFTGVYKVVYYPIPTALTAMTDSLVLDDSTCRTTLANGLASRLLTNENRVMANYFGQIYDELKNRPKAIIPATAMSIEDKYNSSLTY